MTYPEEPCDRCGQHYVLHFFLDGGACGHARKYLRPGTLRAWLWRKREARR